MKFFLEGEDEDLVERDGESYEVDSSREKFLFSSPFYREQFYASIWTKLEMLHYRHCDIVGI